MSLNVVVVRHSTALETGDIVTSVRVLEPGECKYWRIATINMTGDIVRNVGPGTTESTAGQNIPCLCYDVLMLPPPRWSSPAQPSHSPFSLSSVRLNIFFINSQYF